MNSQLKLLLFIGIGLVSSCVTTRRSFDHDPGRDFAAFKTFNWLPMLDESKGQPTVKNTMLDKRFKRTIKEQLELKGYTVETKNPDFFVTYHAPVREKEKVVSAFHGYFHYGYVCHNDFFHTTFPYWGDIYIDTYDEATIIVDIVDSETNELIWRGWRPVAVYGPSISEKRVIRAINKILRDFPPP